MVPGFQLKDVSLASHCMDYFLLYHNFDPFALEDAVFQKILRRDVYKYPDNKR
jgi:hypothetical protein